MKNRLILFELIADKGNMRQLIIAVLLLSSSFLYLYSEEYTLAEGDYSINIPIQWVLNDYTSVQNISFSSPQSDVIVQVLWFEGDEFDDVNNMNRYYTEQLGVELLDQSSLPYLKWDALLTDSSFSTPYGDYRGYFLFLEGDEFDYLVMAYTRKDDFLTFFPYVKSCLDSFSPGDESRRSPGIISTLFYRPEDAVYEKKTQILDGKALIFDYDPFEFEAAQLVIEREAPLLTCYSSGSTEAELAWDRYYRLIYRDNYHRLDPLYESLKPHMAEMNDLEIAESLLQWLQSFEYGSSGTFSDLLSPLTCVVNGVGDCDSLGLAYLILLEHFDIEGVLMVSEVYSHAMAGVAVERAGFSMTGGGENYVVAELTKDVAMGMIASDMADPAGWQLISFK
jgi:hypothetical protein